MVTQDDRGDYPLTHFAFLIVNHCLHVHVTDVGMIGEVVRE